MGGNVDAAIREFQKKFQDKTGNAFADRENFVKKAKKYEPILREYNKPKLIKFSDSDGELLNL